MTTREELQVGSVLRDLLGYEHKVIRFEGIFTVTTYGKGENWLAPEHLKYEEVVKH